MSARKLGRLAGLVFVLAAVFGGIGAATAGNEAGGAAATSAISPSEFESASGADVDRAVAPPRRDRVTKERR